MNSCIKLTQLPTDPTYIAHESTITESWETMGLYKQMIGGEGKSVYRIMDGPPFASGSLHIGHLAPNTGKSIIFNHKTMSGSKCPFKLGTDCHGLPAEQRTCKDNSIDFDQVRAMGAGRFNDLCDEMVDRCKDSWTPLYKSIGRLSDFESQYQTRDPTFMESCWWIFKRLWDMGLVYRAYKVMPYSWACQTSLSNFEINYQEKPTKSVYCAFQLKDTPNRYLVAWTTTAWTLPGNLALCVGDDIKYSVVQPKDSPNQYILAMPCCEKVFGKGVQTIETIEGRDLVGLEYIPVFDYVQQMEQDEKKEPRKYVVISDEYVLNDGTGTGIVHQAPAFGEDDFQICVKHNIVNNVNVLDSCFVDEKGNFDQRAGVLQGLNVFEAEETIRQLLKKKGLLLKTELYRHSYPYCPRTDTPLIYRTIESFYIRVTALKDDMIRLNQTVSWHPKEVGERRFHNWLENIRDWAVSRNRIYGTPIPVFESEDGEMICCGSLDEIERLTGTRPTNLHPQYIKDLLINRDGKIFRWKDLIFDCWFESGCAPYASMHYPFDEKSREIESREFLADFVCEGVDQTRGWFYTSLVISTALHDKAPFRNIMCNEMILDKDGKKMSKRLGNTVDPTKIIERYGSDITRAYLLNSSLMNSEPLRFNEENLEKLRIRFIPMVNAIKFFIEHTMNYQKSMSDDPDFSPHIPLITIRDMDDRDNLMDRWLMESINTLQQNVLSLMDTYQISRAINRLIEHIELLTNWYVKFNRDRLKGNLGKAEWIRSITVLYNYLIRYIQLWAPCMPMMMEMLFSHLKRLNPRFDQQSILLTQYIQPVDHINQTTQLMRDLQRACSMVRNMRSSTPKHNRTIVPLKRCTVYHADPAYLEIIRGSIDLIRQELNCMEYCYEEIGSSILYQAVPDRKVLGPLYGKRGQQLIRLMGELTQKELKDCWTDGHMVVDDLKIPDNGYKIMRIPLKNGMTDDQQCTIDEDLMISIDATYDPMIHQYYQLKKLHKFTQEMRKEMKLRPWNIVRIVIDEKFQGLNMESIVGTMSNATIDLNNGEDLTDYYMKEFDYERFDGDDRLLRGRVWMKEIID